MHSIPIQETRETIWIPQHIYETQDLRTLRRTDDPIKVHKQQIAPRRNQNRIELTRRSTTKRKTETALPAPLLYSSSSSISHTPIPIKVEKTTPNRTCRGHTLWGPTVFLFEIRLLTFYENRVSPLFGLTLGFQSQFARDRDLFAA